MRKLRVMSFGSRGELVSFVNSEKIKQKDIQQICEAVYENALNTYNLFYWRNVK